MSASRLALLSLVGALILSALLVALISGAGEDPRQVWASFMASLPSHLGTLLSLVVVSFVGIWFAFALGWLALKLSGKLVVEAISMAAKPATEVMRSVHKAGASAVEAGASVVQGARDGAASIGSAAAGLVRQGVQYIPGRQADSGIAPRGGEPDTKR
jgi:uncharacterized membrane protein YciS (DUF1049 family)